MNNSEEKLYHDTVQNEIHNHKKQTSKTSEQEKIINNLSVKVTVELGRVKLKIKDFLNLYEGSLLILDKLIDEPLDIFVNDTLIASGEIVVSEKKFGLRIVNVKKSIASI